MTSVSMTGQAHALRLAGDGKIIIAGVSSDNFGVARFTTAGILDTTFDGDGKLTSDIGGLDGVNAVAIGPDYRITAAGRSNGSVFPSLSGEAIARYVVSSGLEERLYAQTDANHNVTSVADVFGAVKERFVYDPYGMATTLTSNWGSTSDTLGWNYLHQGGRYDSVTGLIRHGIRDQSISLGRWVEQDPAGYVDGSNLYQFVHSRPEVATDFEGTDDVLTWNPPPKFPQHRLEYFAGTYADKDKTPLVGLNITFPTQVTFTLQQNDATKCYEYRQFVEGWMDEDGSRPKMVSGKPWIEKWHEDNGKGGPYGHRSNPAAPPDDYYYPTQATGYAYEGRDRVGHKVQWPLEWRGTRGAIRVEFHLHFRIGIVDTRKYDGVSPPTTVGQNGVVREAEYFMLKQFVINRESGNPVVRDTTW